MIGKELGHHQIAEKSGEGGMRVLYKALDTRLDRFVAIQILPPEKVADADRKRHFVQEAIHLAIEPRKEKADKSGLAGRMGAGE